jgi:hypothetical protein
MPEPAVESGTSFTKKCLRALRVRFGPPALNVANYPEDSAIAFWKKPMPFCLSSAGPQATDPCCSSFGILVNREYVGHYL